MSWFVVDVESDGPVPPTYSMVCFGAVLVDEKLDKTFYGQTFPISHRYDPKALSISGFSRAEHEKFDSANVAIKAFKTWIEANSVGRPIFLSDNVAYDWQWINYYFHTFVGGNPFGFSGRRIGDLYCGMVKDSFARWKHLRKTTHTHHPVDDARGNAEALLEMKRMGLKIPTK